MIENLESQIVNTCRFCNPPDAERILYETSNFYVMLSLGPITEGYLLLISKQHFPCCAGINEMLRDEFISLYKRIKQVLTEVYGSCISYEHGRAGVCLIPTEGGKHCYHAHMHFVPISTTINDVIERDFFEIRLSSLTELFETYVQHQSPPYLFVEDDVINFYPIEGIIRRQYLRHKVAKAINKEHLWNWVEFQGWDLIQSAKLNLALKFKDF